MQKIINIVIFLLLFANMSNLFAGDSGIDSLLKEYKKESALSKKTKRDSSGILYLYTREDLERMQVKSLKDILKIVPGINLYRAIDNFSLISTSSNSKSPMSGFRILINDHDMSSASFGSAFLLWGDLNIEYIDHIEIYKATSSVEFGNETAPIIVKLYTKRADREEGGKFRVLADQRGSAISNLYITKTLNDDFSYFVYGELEGLKNRTYKKEYKGQTYNFKGDIKDYNFYSNFIYKKWFFELGMIKESMDSFAGVGLQRTPADNGNDLNAYQQYLHITKKFENGLKLQLSFDNISYRQNFRDLNGIMLIDLRQPLSDCTTKFNDNIYYISLGKEIKSRKNRLYLGGFYKYKSVDAKNLIDFLHAPGTSESSYSNSLNYSSIYTEDEFKVTERVSFLGQLKGDFFRLKKDLGSYVKKIYKAGIKYKDKNLFLQFLYTHSYLPVTFFEYYDSSKFPYSANIGLKTPVLNIYEISSKYRFDDGYLKLVLGDHYIDKPITYYPQIGFMNLNKETEYNLLELSYYKELDDNSNLELIFYDTYNHSSKLFSPKWGVTLKLFNNFEKVDIYNELVFKSSYISPYNIEIKRSYDWTASVKYHISKDFSIGMRGENILNKGLEQAYNRVPYSIPVVEQKFWLNLEYLF